MRPKETLLEKVRFHMFRCCKEYYPRTYNNLVPQLKILIDEQNKINLKKGIVIEPEMIGNDLNTSNCFYAKFVLVWLISNLFRI